LFWSTFLTSVDMGSVLFTPHLAELSAAAVVVVSGFVVVVDVVGPLVVVVVAG
jgi:hypothetical protein